ncbi:hypothetical protein RO3G_06113 [Rhizopus delemar RA 99-880]|uniref:DUF2421 domain-containing protein n=1 Tax=Rhizopus delemar (strain RA 99-880 / ATCC MYA-4621 / FGSC 9543 / NRRL 43880) TaxID=246409 RepID=I1BYX8_RHIO9|nr:hypothetical protein RO3G_06113 [Rhizopus delemar RA 99-880]|eukprot:EIE81408.1 hypothetical protein RO3G_06113 [Rhizopus delemar RA 99-880]
MVTFVDTEKGLNSTHPNTDSDEACDLGEKTNSMINGQTIHFEEHLKENTIIIEDLPVPPTSKKRKPLVTNLVFFKWICDQCKDDKNRYAFQMATAFTLAALFVVIKPVAHIFENAFWIGVAVVTILDNTVGGFLTLSFQRIIGTVVGGVLSIIVMTIVRAIFQPQWDARAAVLLCFFMFAQVFVIARLKQLPNYSYAGGIGLLTTVIILLSGYNDIIHGRLSKVSELGAWRTCNLVIGVVIAMMVSFCVFPVTSTGIMRANLGKSMEKSANLYQRLAEFYLDFKQGESDHSLVSMLERKAPIEDEQEPPSIKETLQRIFSNTQMDPQVNQNQVWTNDEITTISNEAIAILFQLQTESTRLRNVSNEYNFRLFFYFLEGGKDHCKRLTVMRKLGSILKDRQRPLSDFKEDWLEIHRMVAAGNAHAQRELKETVQIGMNHQNMDGYKLLSYYGFLVRFSAIWDGLKTVVDLLSPLNGTLSRPGSVQSESTCLPNREVIHVPE